MDLHLTLLTTLTGLYVVLAIYFAVLSFKVSELKSSTKASLGVFWTESERDPKESCVMLDDLAWDFVTRYQWSDLKEDWVPRITTATVESKKKKKS